MKQQIIRYWVGLALLSGMLFSSCEDEASTYTYDENLIGMIIVDNPNLSYLNTSMRRTDLFNTLLEEGPFTLFAPSNDAFTASGYSESDVSSIGKDRLTKIMNYHILPGGDKLNSLPLGFNQEVVSPDGVKFFITLFDNGTDTLLTINGAPSARQFYSASNGNIRIINRVLEPYLFEYLTDAISNESDLTFFRQALKRTSLNEQLAKAGNYTVFALNNELMSMKYGLSSMEVINRKSVEDLEAFLRKHIIADRRFVYDYVLLKPQDSEKISEQMLDGEERVITLVPDPKTPGSYSSITLADGNNVYILKRENLLAGNGVVHIIGLKK